jgi:peptide/nickel transport system substrate-binding protein
LSCLINSFIDFPGASELKSPIFYSAVFLLCFSLTVSAAGAASETTSEKDIIRIASGFRTLTLDPTRSVWTGSIETFGQLYSRLFRRGENRELLPGLAERWEISEDGKHYTFHLRPARFSNGSPITAEDVAFSLLRVRDDPESAYPTAVSGLAGVTVIDPQTVRLELDQPLAPFLDSLEMCFLGIVSKKDVETRGNIQAFAVDPVTSGPYRVKEWRHNDRVILEPNPHYWREGFPRNDGAELIEVVDGNTRAAMLLAGEIDAMRSVAWTQAQQLSASDRVNMPHEPAILIW